MKTIVRGIIFTFVLFFIILLTHSTNSFPEAKASHLEGHTTSCTVTILKGNGTPFPFGGPGKTFTIPPEETYKIKVVVLGGHGSAPYKLRYIKTIHSNPDSNTPEDEVEITLGPITQVNTLPTTFTTANNPFGSIDAGTKVTVTFEIDPEWSGWQCLDNTADRYTVVFPKDEDLPVIGIERVDGSQFKLKLTAFNAIGSSYTVRGHGKVECSNKLLDEGVIDNNDWSKIIDFPKACTRAVFNVEGADTVDVKRGIGEQADLTDQQAGGDGEPVDPTEVPGLSATGGADVNEVAGGFASSFLSFGIGIGGGIAFLLMIFGAYRLMFAAGNPESVQQGQQIITAAIAGLLVIVFASFILRFIGFTLFGL